MRRLACAVLLVVSSLACKKPSSELLVSRAQTFAELRSVKRGVTVTVPEEAAKAGGERHREPYARERLVDGEQVSIDAGGLAWLRRDGGATLLVTGPGALVLHSDAVEVTQGKVFVDTLASLPADLRTPRGVLHLSRVRASIEVGKDGAVTAYVIEGGVRTDDGASCNPGELLTLSPQGNATKTTAVAWEDWTGGLATTDPSAQPAPFGVGTVGARKPGDKGQPRFPLAIQRMDVRVTIDGDFATTEVDQVFFNPTADTVEGIYQFRVPDGATLHKFGVDRDGSLVWGYVKEKQAALTQYQEHVYQGSTEDPALLEWDAPGVFKARLYPIGSRATRRIVTRYGEWLGRQGKRGERRLYVYPMAAEGSEATLPRIEELTLDIDLARAAARDIRVGMQGKLIGDRVIVKGFDVVPRADLAVELYDDGPKTAMGYRAPHTLDLDTMPPAEIAKAAKDARKESDYLLIPVRPTRANEPAGGLDLAIVVDTSAATEPSALSVARAATGALLSYLGPDDRAAVWAGDATLRAVAPGSDQFATIDTKRREAIATGLAQVDRGGATDVGAIISDAASRLDAGRRGAIVYIGDGDPTVGELSVPELRERLQRLPHPVRLFALGIGDRANFGLLNGIARGAFAARVGDAHEAATTALRVLEEAERPVWLGASVDLGPGIDRVFPRELGTLVADQSALVVGRIVGELPKKLVVHGSGGELATPLTVRPLTDGGDLRRRWAEGRLVQLLDEGAGRAAVVEVGVRSGVITPFTSLYVPTADEHRREIERDDVVAIDETGVKPWWRWPWFMSSFGGSLSMRKYEPASVAMAPPSDDREGGTGTRAKGEEGSMGNPSRAAGKRYAIQGPGADTPRAQAGEALKEAAEFGMIGLLNNAAGGEPSAATATAAPQPSVAAPPALRASPPEATKPQAAWGNAVGDSFGAGGLGLAGGGGLAGVGSGGRGAGLAGAHSTPAPKLKEGKIQILDNKKRDDAPSSSANKDKAAKSVSSDLEQTLKKQAALALPLGAVGHVALPCAPAADLPFEERLILWRERVSAAGGNWRAMAMLYDNVLRGCEAPTWRERTQLLILLVEFIPTVRDRVELWRNMQARGQAAEVVYRAMLTRIHTAAEIHDLHDALGLRQIDPAVLTKALGDRKTALDRAELLRGLVSQWPDDLELALKLLEAYEDAGDDAGGRALARRLRRRGDANTRVRTAVGEYYLRLAARGVSPAKERDSTEARRTFGEIVEFAPEDPGARRRLGDLLRAHGWYDEAMRQYETLARLSPDDSSVQLLLAAAAQGMGRTEEAIGYTERAAGVGAPEGSPMAKTSRSLASAFLAWARDEAIKGGHRDEADRLRERARRLSVDTSPGGIRLILTWSHPELHPELWSNAPGTLMPAADGNPLLGVAETQLSASAGPLVELHLEHDDAERAARLGAEAALTAIIDEGNDGERIIRVPVSFARVNGKALEKRRFRWDGSTLHEEAVL
jgi:Ca-activated chloride channel family protein